MCTLGTGGSRCQLITIPPNTFRVLPCKLRSNLARRKWRYSDGASQSLYATPEGSLVVVAQADKTETYECWSEEESFRQLLANYCVRAEPRQDSTTTTTALGHSRTPHVRLEEVMILPGESRSHRVCPCMSSCPKIYDDISCPEGLAVLWTESEWMRFMDETPEADLAANRIHNAHVHKSDALACGGSVWKHVCNV